MSDGEGDLVNPFNIARKNVHQAGFFEITVGECSFTAQYQSCDTALACNNPIFAEQPDARIIRVLSRQLQWGGVSR